eukprot:1154037-Pelagomonas_calceolata.AAC.1
MGRWGSKLQDGLLAGGRGARLDGSRPDHILMSDKVFGIADCVHMTEDRAISDHCPISMTFQ